MEIKKGISQMAEYPNVEINYVMSRDGKMHYVLKEGELENGCIIATLDPKHAIDETNPSTTVGVFSSEGDIIIDFNKKSIKSIDDDLVLVENSKLSTPEVVGIIGKEDDPNISKTVNEAKERITQDMKDDMGEQGEIIFCNPYSEANVYRVDRYNHSLGLDSSYIGKNEKGLYFHTNDINSETMFKEVDDFHKKEDLQETSEDVKLDINSDALNNFAVSDQDLEDVKQQSDEDMPITPDEVEETKETDQDTDSIESPSQVFTPPLDEEDEKDNQDDSDDDIEEDSDEVSSDESDNIKVDSEEDESDDIKADSEENESDDIKADSEENESDDMIEDTSLEQEEDQDNKSSLNEETPEDDEREEMQRLSFEEDDDDDDDIDNKEKKSSDNNEILDNAIEVINKMIKETNKLNKRIIELEDQLKEKEEIIKESESKRDELNEILDKANEVLEEIK